VGEGEGAAGGAVFDAVFCERGEAGGVGAGRAGGAENLLVAGELALKAEAALDPEEGGVEREEDKSELLEEVEPVVCAAEVGAFVEDDLVELVGGEALEEPAGDEDLGGEEADDAGAVDFVGDAELGGSRVGARCPRVRADYVPPIAARWMGHPSERGGAVPEGAEAEGGDDEGRGADERGEGPEGEDGEAPAGVENEERVGRGCDADAMGEEGDCGECGDGEEDGEPDGEASGGRDFGKKAQGEGCGEREQDALPDSGGERTGGCLREGPQGLDSELREGVHCAS
jgi:hypothetical protein